VRKLNDERYFDLIIVDDFSDTQKNKNLEGKKFTAKVHRDVFIEWLRKNHRLVQFVFHLGARTDTTESDKSIFDRLNLNYSRDVWTACVELGLPLVYASSAATYGNGECGYDDAHELTDNLKPLNPYGESKQEFDRWALMQLRKPYFWAGLKFFNVYGPNEYHKGRMASVVFHSFNQIFSTGRMKLFRSHNPKYKDGEQLRDFVYVKDVVDVCFWLMLLRKNSGIYNLGTGKARTFLDLTRAVFSALGKPEKIDFIDTPLDIRNKYQYFTEAKMEKLRSIGYSKSFTPLQDGIKDYVSRYLASNKYF
jgi:ADP-L-glycero-D-manno-heptose 6-epimerase